MHAALATALERPSDVERRAWHRAGSALGPDEAVARGLDDVARAVPSGGVRSRRPRTGSPRAASLSVDDDARADPTPRGRRRVARGRALEARPRSARRSTRVRDRSAPPCRHRGVDRSARDVPRRAREGRADPRRGGRRDRSDRSGTRDPPAHLRGERRGVRARHRRSRRARGARVRVRRARGRSERGRRRPRRAVEGGLLAADPTCRHSSRRSRSSPRHSSRATSRTPSTCSAWCSSPISRWRTGIGPSGCSTSWCAGPTQPAALFLLAVALVDPDRARLAARPLDARRTSPRPPRCGRRPRAARRRFVAPRVAGARRGRPRPRRRRRCPRRALRRGGHRDRLLRGDRCGPRPRSGSTSSGAAIRKRRSSTSNASPRSSSGAACTSPASSGGRRT